MDIQSPAYFMDRVARSRDYLMKKKFGTRATTPRYNEKQQKQDLRTAKYYFSNDQDKRMMRAKAMKGGYNAMYRM